MENAIFGHPSALHIQCLSVLLLTRQPDIYLLHKYLRKKVFYKLLEVLICCSIMEKPHFAIDDSKNRWDAMSTEVLTVSHSI